MPELPEVEVLVRHLGPRLKGRCIQSVAVRRSRVIAPTSERALRGRLGGARLVTVARRGKYLLFVLRRKTEFTLLGHLGMSGRMYLRPINAAEPKHAAVVLGLGKEKLVYEDPRYFGRLTLDTRPLERLGPEPLSKEFKLAEFAQALRRSSQAIKVKLLNQRLVAGLGNIYASEALFRARIAPAMPARKLNPAQIARLHRAIPVVLKRAIRFGSTIAIGQPKYGERLLVYDRAGLPCGVCRAAIKRIVQAARSTYYCPRCQTKH